MTEQTMYSAMTIRRLDVAEADREALARLVARDSSGPLDAPVIGIEVEGRLLAAASLTSGAVVSDPFSRTEELRTMLELRAAQLTRRAGGSPKRLRIPRRRPQMALAGGLSAIPR